MTKVTLSWAGAQSAASFAAQETAASDSNGSHATKISDNFMVNGNTFAYWLIKWNGAVQVASVRLSGTNWLWVYAALGSYTNYANSWPGYTAPTPTPTPSPTPGPVWTINAEGTFSNDYAGSVVTYLCASSGEVLQSDTLIGGSYAATIQVPTSCGSVEMYVNDVLWHTFQSGDTSSQSPMDWGDVEKTPLTLSVGPGVNGGGFAGSTNSDGTWVNAPITDGTGSVIGYVGTNVPVQYELRYVSGVAQGRFSVNQVVYEGEVEGGSSSSVSTNLALRPGGIYSVAVAVPNFQWVYPGDGIDPLLVPTSTNYVTNIVNIPGGLGSQNVYVPGPVLPNPGSFTNPNVSVTNTSTNNITNSPGIVGGNNSSPIVTNEPTVDIQFETLSLQTQDYGEQEILGRAAGVLGTLQAGLDAWGNGIANINEALQRMSGLTPPTGSGGCTLTMGMVTIDLGSSPWPQIRSMLIYGVYIVAVFGAGKLVLSIFD